MNRVILSQKEHTTDGSTLSTPAPAINKKELWNGLILDTHLLLLMLDSSPSCELKNFVVWRLGYDQPLLWRRFFSGRFGPDRGFFVLHRVSFQNIWLNVPASPKGPPPASPFRFQSFLLLRVHAPPHFAFSLVILWAEFPSQETHVQIVYERVLQKNYTSLRNRLTFFGSSLIQSCSLTCLVSSYQWILRGLKIIVIKKKNHR